MKHRLRGVVLGFVGVQVGDGDGEEKGGEEFEFHAEGLR
ncbi:hypothetical protein CfE428DRAFT_6582 [Chthoniobacter flavus Ellin428]|uniref:Uncharacterized protein n=1 Tax=Chthoniobacter flavus Ellin428 TaxID=497964 RepID=B4DCE1_9BACT|nr:hypothetical protein CfE428DRAFT_6582 [Chthoniobacter flavus Ellin428]